MNTVKVSIFGILIVLLGVGFSVYYFISNSETVEQYEKSTNTIQKKADSLNDKIMSLENNIENFSETAAKQEESLFDKTYAGFIKYNRLAAKKASKTDPLSNPKEAKKFDKVLKKIAYYGEFAEQQGDVITRLPFNEKVSYERAADYNIGGSSIETKNGVCILAKYNGKLVSLIIGTFNKDPGKFVDVNYYLTKYGSKVYDKISK